jgi:ferredoxin
MGEAALSVDPIACEAHGLCAELFPERITLDDWGYPIIDPTPIPRELVGHARRAVDACPTLALRFETRADSTLEALADASLQDGGG